MVSMMVSSWEILKVVWPTSRRSTLWQNEDWTLQNKGFDRNLQNGFKILRILRKWGYNRSKTAPSPKSRILQNVTLLPLYFWRMEPLWLGKDMFFGAQIRDLQDGPKWTIYQPLSSFEQNIFKFSSGEVTQNFRGSFCKYKDGRFRLGPRMTRLHFQFQVWTPFIKSPDYFTAPCGSFAFISGVNLGTILLPIHRNVMKRLAESSIRSPRHFGVSLRRNHCRLGTQDGDGKPTKK